METSTSDLPRIEAALLRTKHMGATSLRWNALLKGLELDWRDGVLVGLKPGCAQAVRTVADMALAHGVQLQIVLGTAHFLRWGYGGADNVLHGIANRARVSNIHRMMKAEAGVAAFLETVVDPIVDALGGVPHPAVYSFLVFNEGYAAVRKDDKVFWDETDETITLHDLQRWVNRVAGRLRKRLPGTLCSASLKLRVHEAFMTRQGKLNTAEWFEDEMLISAGGDPLGTMQLHQYQYYPAKAYGAEASPFLNTAAALSTIHHTSRKPVIAGEFPVDGIEAAAGHNPTSFTLQAAYEALWSGGYSGGYVWNSDKELAFDGGRRAAVAAAYQSLATKVEAPGARATASGVAGLSEPLSDPCRDVVEGVPGAVMGVPVEGSTIGSTLSGQAADEVVASQPPPTLHPSSSLRPSPPAQPCPPPPEPSEWSPALLALHSSVLGQVPAYRSQELPSPRAQPWRAAAWPLTTSLEPVAAPATAPPICPPPCAIWCPGTYLRGRSPNGCPACGCEEPDLPASLLRRAPSPPAPRAAVWQAAATTSSQAPTGLGLPPSPPSDSRSALDSDLWSDASTAEVLALYGSACLAIAAVLWLLSLVYRALRVRVADASSLRPTSSRHQGAQKARSPKLAKKRSGGGGGRGHIYEGVQVIAEYQAESADESPPRPAPLDADPIRTSRGCRAAAEMGQAHSDDQVASDVRVQVRWAVREYALSRGYLAALFVERQLPYDVSTAHKMVEAAAEQIGGSVEARGETSYSLVLPSGLPNARRVDAVHRYLRKVVDKAAEKREGRSAAHASTWL